MVASCGRPHYIAGLVFETPRVYRYHIFKYIIYIYIHISFYAILQEIYILFCLRESGLVNIRFSFQERVNAVEGVTFFIYVYIYIY